jgi:hypothetical protein
MKKLVSFIAVIIITVNVFAQSPEKMSYQAVVRNASNGLISNTTIGMKISILQGSSSGTVVYAETQSPTTDANGLATLEIGTGSIISGVFSTIDWSAGPYFIKTETDPSGGTTYTITGTTQLMSVPYALHAKTATNFTETDPKIGTNTTGYSPKWNGTALVTGSIYQADSGNVGIGTTSPNTILEVNGQTIIDHKTGTSRLTIASTSGATPFLTFGGSSGGIIETATNTLSMRFGSNTTASSVDFEPAKVTFRTGGFFSYERMTINSTGNVGIGTTSPTTKLDVNGVIQTNDYLKISNLSNASKTLFQILNGNGNGINMGVDNGSNTNPYITFSSPGTTTLWKMNSNASTYTIKNNYNNAFISLNSWDTNNGEVIMGANGVENLRITNQGRVGIGTTTPSTLLDVNGVITATGGNSTNWNTAYGWGNHASAGYVTATYLAAISDVADEFTATTSQTNFTLSQTPATNSKVKMYINGIRISNTAYSHTGTALTYVPANNGSYALASGDRIQFDYYK